MKEKLYAVRLSKEKMRYEPGSRYLLWIDECWYESAMFEMFNFKEDELETIKKQLSKHFIYHAEFICNDGTSLVWDYFKKPIKKSLKMSGFKVKLG